MRILARGLLVVALLCCVALAAPEGSRAAGPDHVALQLKWTHQFQFAGYYAASAKGYYRDAGLDVELREAVPGQDPSERVLCGQADFGVGTSDLVVLRAKRRPVVVLADILQHSALVLLARKEPGVDDLQSLARRKLMIEPLSAELFAYFKDEGIDPAKLRLTPHTFDVNDLIRGRVDAMSAYSTDETYTLKQRHFPFLMFTPRAGGIDFYGDNLFTTEREIKEHPERVRLFRQASLRGWEYAMSHQREIVDLILRDYRRAKSRGQLLFEAQQTALLMHPELIEIGHTNPGRWRNIAETYGEFGMVPHRFDLDGFLYDANAPPNLTWLYWALAGTTLLAIGTLGWALPLFRLNLQLRAAKETAEAADRTKSAYVAVMTHEVRAPLSVIVGFVELLREGPLSGAQRKNVDMIGNSVQGLLALINDVLDFARFENDRLTFERLPVNVAELIGESCEQFRPATVANGVALNFHIEPGTPEVILSDPMRLRQAVVNLLSNAAKFTEKGEIEVGAGTTPVDGRLRLTIRVRDTGIGISPDRLSQIFDPYAQADESIARRFGGTGLGLAIARRIAEGLGGEITVRSAPGQGSTFEISILTSAGAPERTALRGSAP